jgi:hypothetical protein
MFGSRHRGCAEIVIRKPKAEAEEADAPAGETA